MTKNDIVYAAAMYGAKYQATVTVACHNNQQFAGELCDSEKEAHQSAAYQALVQLQDEMGGAEKRTGTEMSGDSKARKVDGTEDGLSVEIKTRMQEMLKQIVGRNLIENDTIYEYVDLPTGGHQCTIKFFVCQVCGVKLVTLAQFRRSSGMLCSLRARRR